MSLDLSNSSKDKFLFEQELKILQRSEENFTHRVDTEYKIKRITTWRRSSAKFKISLIFNIFTFGIIHLISIKFIQQIVIIS